MEDTYFIGKVRVGYHPDGYRIDTNDSPIGPYTKWEISSDGQWCNPQSTRFEDIPLYGWIKAEKFSWEGIEGPIDITGPILVRGGH